MENTSKQLVFFELEPSTSSTTSRTIAPMQFDPNLSPITAALAVLVAKSDMALAQIAFQAGIDRSAITRYLNGEREPKATTLADIERVLGCDYGTVYGLAAKCAKQRIGNVRSQAA